MLKHVDREIEYRMAKWLLRNLEKHELVTPAEIEKIWSELIEIYAPPTQSNIIYRENKNSVTNLKLSTSGSGFDARVTLSFNASIRKGFFTSLIADFKLVVADSNGDILGVYQDRDWCYREGTHYLDFRSSEVIYGHSNAIELFCDDYNNGGTNFQIYIDEVTVNDGERSSNDEWGITQQPTDQNATVGQRATFTINTFGDGLSYQWHVDRKDGKGWIKIDGANGSAYVTSVIDETCDGFEYYCKVTSPNEGDIDSAAAVLHVVTMPETGDSSGHALWLTIMLMSVFAILVLLKNKELMRK